MSPAQISFMLTPMVPVRFHLSAEIWSTATVMAYAWDAHLLEVITQVGFRCFVRWA